MLVSEGSRHIVVQRGGRFWTVDLIDSDGNTVPVAQLHGAMQVVIDAADAAPAADDETVGLLTSLPRDEWAALRTRLLAEAATNVASVEAIDSAIFVLSLDVEAPSSITEVSSAGMAALRPALRPIMKSTWSA